MCSKKAGNRPGFRFFCNALLFRNLFVFSSARERIACVCVASGDVLLLAPPEARMLKIVGAAFFMMSVALLTGLVQLKASYDAAARGACRLVDQHYYRRERTEVRRFVQWCLDAAQNQSFLLSRSANIKRINDRLAAMRISHLSVYSPAENKLMWENQGLDTGIRSRMVEDQLVVYRVLPQSPADRAGLQPGDSLIALGGEQLNFALAAQTGSGHLRFRRQGKEMAVDLAPEELIEEMSPTLTDLGRGRGLLRLPSFLSQHFAGQEVRDLIDQLSHYKSIVIDLRDNAGGSFPAMLRALSPFFCRPTAIGMIYHSPAPGLRAEVDLRDDLDSQSQLGQLAQAEAIVLRTFPNYGCFRGKVRALIDQGTSSVAEIFAQALFSREDTYVFGQPTSGQVVMAQWFPLAALGSDSFVMSVPIAGYRTISGLDLEDNGVHPQSFLFYDLPAALAGRDNWIESALASF